MAIWPVNIVGNPATFVAPLQPKADVGTVYADPRDVVFWNNTTTENHKISLLALTPDEPPDTGVVTPGHQTDAFTIDPQAKAGTTYKYCCALHPAETGQIIVTGPKT